MTVITGLQNLEDFIGKWHPIWKYEVSMTEIQLHQFHQEHRDSFLLSFQLRDMVFPWEKQLISICHLCQLCVEELKFQASVAKDSEAPLVKRKLVAS